MFCKITTDLSILAFWGWALVAALKKKKKMVMYSYHTGVNMTLLLSVLHQLVARHIIEHGGPCLTFFTFISLGQILWTVWVNSLGADELPHPLSDQWLPHHCAVVHNQPYNVRVNRGVDERGVIRCFDAMLLDGSHWARATAEHPCREWCISCSTRFTYMSHKDRNKIKSELLTAH